MIVDNGSGEVTVEIPESLPSASMLNQNTDTYNDYLGIKPPFGLPASVMPGEVPYTSQLPYLVHPAMKTHPSFVPPTDGSMIQGASPLYSNFIPPTQVGGYAGTNQGYCGNTYLPDQQAPITSNSGAGTHLGLVNSTAAFGTQLENFGQQNLLGNLNSSMASSMMGGNMSQMQQLQQLRQMQQRASMQPGIFSLAPNDQNFVQASGQQNLYVPAGSMMPQPSAMIPQNNWMHAQGPDRTPHLSTPMGMPPGTQFHAQPTTFANVYQVPSAFGLDLNGQAQNAFQ